MKTISAIFISSLLMLFSLSLTTAQEDTIPYPPITPENASQLEMIQVLSNDEIYFQWSPDSTKLIVNGVDDTWIYDVTDENLPSYHLQGYRLSQYAPNHDFYISYDTTSGCTFSYCDKKIYIRDANTHEILHEIYDQIQTIFPNQGSFVGFSPDGNLLVVASYIGLIRIWETESFLINQAENPDDFMLCKIETVASPAMIQFSPDSSQITYKGFKLMMASRNDPSLWFWDTHTCEVNFQKQVFPDDDFEHNAEFIDYSDDGRYLIFTDYIEGGNFLWDAISWENLGMLSRDEIGYTNIIGFSPDSNHIVFENEDEQIIKIWNIESQTVVQEYEGTHAWYLSDGHLIINRDRESYLITETGEQVIYNPQPTTHTYVAIDENSKSELIREISGLVYPSPDNKYVAFTDDNGFISILEIETLEERHIKDFITTGEYIYWSQSDTIAVTYGEGLSKNFIDVWEYGESAFQHVWRKQYPDGALTTITDEFIILTIENNLEFFDSHTGELMYSFSSSDCDSQSNSHPACNILAIAMPLVQSHTSSILVESNVRVSDDRNHLEVFDPITDEVITSYPTPIEDISSYTSSWRFDESGGLLFATESKLYNLTQNRLVVEMSPVVAGYQCMMDCTPDSELTPYYYESSRTWLSDDLNFLLSLEEDKITYKFEPHGLEDSAIIRIWDIQTNQEVIQIPISPVDSFEFTFDLGWLFVFREDVYNGNGTQVWLRGDLKIYKGLTGENIADLSIHRESGYDMPLHDAQFSPDNRFLITSSDTLRVWAVVPEDETP